MKRYMLLIGRLGNSPLTLDRLVALSDGVVAIVLTLLVLGLNVQPGRDFRHEGLLPFLASIEYKLTVYAISFTLIGSYWLQHNVMFHFLRNGSRRLARLNLLFLFILTLIPFATQLIGVYQNEPLVIVIYGVVHIACGCSLAFMWWYANRMAFVVWPRIDPAVVRSMLRRILMGPVVSLAAIGIAFINVRLAHLAFFSIPLFHFSHQAVDTHWPQVVPCDKTDSD